MDVKNIQESPFSSSSSCLKEKLNHEMVHHTTQPSPNALGHQLQHPRPHTEQTPKNDEPKRNNTYTCPHCPKTFPTHMALSRHQNGHRRLRDLAIRKAGTSLSYQPYPTNYPSYPNYYPYYRPLALNQKFSLGMRTDSIAHNPSYVLQSGESTSSSVDIRSLLKEHHAKMRVTQPATTSAPLLAISFPPQATSTMFFGVQNFFGASSAAGKTPSSDAGNFMSVKDKKEKNDVSELDLDLKL